MGQAALALTRAILVLLSAAALAGAADRDLARVSLASHPPKSLEELVPKRVGRFTLQKAEKTANDRYWVSQGAGERVKATFNPAGGGFDIVTYEVVQLPSPAQAQTAIQELTTDSAKVIRDYKIVRQGPRLTGAGESVGITIVVHYVVDFIYWTNGPYVFIVGAPSDKAAAEFAQNLPY